MNERLHGTPSESSPDEPHRSTSTPPPPPQPAGQGGQTGWSTSPGTAASTQPWQGTEGEASAGDDAPSTAGSSTALPPYGTTGPTTSRHDTAVLATTPPPQDPPKKGRARLLLASLVIGAVVGGGAGAGVATWMSDDDAAIEQPVQSSLNAGEETDNTNQPAASLNSVESVAEKILPSVVSITFSTGGLGGGTGGGTGVVISSDGEILTNNHVASAAGPNGNLQVTFEDGNTAEAEVIGTDPLTDLAVIKAQDVSGLTPAQLGSSGELQVGEQVVAIGSPLGLEGTVTSGIVSALQRPVAVGEERNATTVIDAIQTDAPINQGNSGGPLVNMAGEVIGINSVIATSGMDTGSIGLGFAIPVDQAKPIAEELIDSGNATHARIGVGVNTPPEGQRGALVAEVEPNGSAADAGLQQGDIITKIDDRPIADHISLIAAARSYRPGDEVTITYLRDGEEHTTELTLGSDAQST